MALSRTHLGNFQSSAAHGTGTFTAGAFTPPDNSLLVVVVSAQGGASTINADIEAALTLTDDLGSPLSWTKRVGINYLSTASGVREMASQIWTAAVVTGAEMSLVLDCGEFSIGPYDVKVYAYAGHDAGLPVGAAASGNGDSTLASITLSSSPDAASEVIAALAIGGNDVAIDPGSGWTELHETFVNFINAETQARTGSTSQTVEWATTTNANGAFGIQGVALEIRADSGAAGGEGRSFGMVIG